MKEILVAGIIAALAIVTVGSINSYLEKSCFSEECTETEKMIAAFTVRVSDKEHFSFASQCCQGEGCNANRTVSAPSSEGKPGSTICPACHESNETSCTNKSQTCNQEEKCVELVAFFKNDVDSKTLVLKGCANVSDTTCQFLSNSSRITFGGITFQQFNCRDAATPTSVPTSTQTTTAKTTTPSSATKVSFIPLTLGSLLLLVLTL
ncbi:PREDICTED: ly6/PLAUR domain-containing protein 8-like [Elephantulus edwardii]|uniref:ly6/PLAUR domain-containing protein 8-like n=1 Tax=Elephantulus edwardii TaxID=28737 RepID=UPI0003F0C982|nr:PREDICTED: ly6/PLAUR domain-containing protein 8-like [Elephantulus edwardii]